MEVEPLSQAHCEKLIEKYSDDLEFWNRFWRFMETQIQKGASNEYVQQSFQSLEAAWESHR